MRGAPAGGPQIARAITAHASAHLDFVLEPLELDFGRLALAEPRLDHRLPICEVTRDLREVPKPGRALGQVPARASA